jgi:hypothetical protein
MTLPNFQVAPGGSFLRLGDIYIMSGSVNPTNAVIHAPTGSVFIRNAGSASAFYWNYTTSDSGSQWRSAGSG